MRQICLMVIATILGVSLGGCLGQGETPTTTESPPAEAPVATSPSPEASPSDSAATPPAQTESPPSVAALPRTLDLIPSTNPDQRIQAVQRERSDPFAVVPTTPTISIEILDDGSEAQASTADAGQASGGRTSQASSGGTAGGRGQASGGQTATPGGGLAPIPNLVPGRTTTNIPPRLPQPTLARAVEVLGVVQIGNVPYAIVSAPNEPTSRYVREGQRLANGQVMVRRIEMNGPAPAVVFEQHGIEVVTAVGEGGIPESSEETPAATLPARNPQQPG